MDFEISKIDEKQRSPADNATIEEMKFSCYRCNTDNINVLGSQLMRCISDKTEILNLLTMSKS